MRRTCPRRDPRISLLFGPKYLGGVEAGLHARLMHALEIRVEDPRWDVIDLETLAPAALRATLQHLTLDADLCEVSLLACDDAHITTLNTDFRARAAATNVLSWPAEERGAARGGQRPALPQPGPDGMIALGDIAISYDTCAAEAAAADKPIFAHVTHLLVHGTLHLLGYDHIRGADGDLMEALEVEILGNLGLDDPYKEQTARSAGEHENGTDGRN